MSELEQFFCPNKKCKDYGMRRQGNISIRGKYGKDNLSKAQAVDNWRNLKIFSERW